MSSYAHKQKTNAKLPLEHKNVSVGLNPVDNTDVSLSLMSPNILAIARRMQHSTQTRYDSSNRLFPAKRGFPKEHRRQ